MPLEMLAVAARQLQVLRSVVRPVVVLVVNDFLREQRSSEHPLHHHPVLVPAHSSRRPNPDVSVLHLLPVRLRPRPLPIRTFRPCLPFLRNQFQVFGPIVRLDPILVPHNFFPPPTDWPPEHLLHHQVVLVPRPSVRRPNEDVSRLLHPPCLPFSPHHSSSRPRKLSRARCSTHTRSQGTFH